MAQRGVLRAVVSLGVAAGGVCVSDIRLDESKTETADRHFVDFYLFLYFSFSLGLKIILVSWSFKGILRLILEIR